MAYLSSTIQDHFFGNNALKTNSSKKLLAQFRYTGLKRRYDHLPGKNHVEVDSIIYNHNQISNASEKYSGDNAGDSFTNISYIQELSVRFMPPGGAVYFEWSEN